MKLSKFYLLIVLFGLYPVSVFSQDTAAPPPAHCENNAGFSDWDFWVGEWNVYSNDEARTFAWNNSITKHYRGCLIKETWDSSGGGGGFSVNYYNPVKSEWRQVWISNGYAIDYTGGLNEAGAMVLEGEIYYYARGVAQKMRGIWTPENNGDVIQHFDTYNEETNEWQVWFEGRYVRKENDTNAPAVE